VKKKRKNRILLSINVVGWAYDNRADNLIKELSWKYDFQKITIDECASKKPDFFADFDCIFLPFWENCHYLETLQKNIPKEKLMTGVFSWASWKGNEKKLLHHLHKHAVIVVNCHKLYKYLQGKHPNIFYTPNGVDTKVFYPIEKNETKNFIVGWAGNPDRKDVEGKDLKGYYSIIVPVLEKLKNVKLKSVLMGKNQMPISEMPKFYNSIDAYICVSENECTPNPCMEAAACGKPVITTVVGVMPELIKHAYNGIFIERNKESLEKAIYYLMNNHQEALKIGKNARKIIEDNWTWELLAKNYEKPFDFIINNQ